jgi:hypothetical protein
VAFAACVVVAAAHGISRRFDTIGPGTGPPPKVRDGVANGMPQARADVAATSQGTLILPPGNR